MSTAATLPSGFGIVGVPAIVIVLCKSRKTKPTATTSTANRASHRQRLEGRCPSGNSRKRKAASPAGNTTQLSGSCSQATHSANGSAVKWALR